MKFVPVAVFILFLAASGVMSQTDLKLTADNVIVQLNFDQDSSPDDITVSNTKLPNRADYQKTDTVAMPADTTVISVLLTNENGNGPAGFLASTTDGRVITNKSWKCTNAEHPGNGWGQLHFDDSQWPQATEIEQNGGKTWGLKSDISSSAYWIWTNNTAKDLAIYCRYRIKPIDLVLTADNVINALYIDGQQIPSTQLPNAADYDKTDTVSIPAFTKLIAVKLTNDYGAQGFLASSSDNHFNTNKSWKCTKSPGDGWEKATYDDSTWSQATEIELNGGSTWTKKTDISSSAYWIWTNDSWTAGLTIYCRFHI